MKKQLITLILILASISSNAQSWWGSNSIKGNGNSITKTRSISSFNEVILKGPFTVNLIDATEGTLTIQGEENILPYIETYVKKGIFYLKFKDNSNINTTRKIIITVPFQAINGASLSGSGNINIKKTIKESAIYFSVSGSGNINATVNNNAVKTVISGSGNINLKGETDNFKCTVAGSGNIRAYNLNANSLNANVSGSGTIRARVSLKINATVSGSGNIYYKGNPKYIDSNTSGSGNIIDRN